VRLSPSLFLAALLASPLAYGQNTPAPRTAPSPTTQPNPASAPVRPASDAGATERGLAPVHPGAPHVSNGVRNANTHDVDAQGHVLDGQGKPVGQAPSPASLPGTSSTVH
jgi:hypothetical protein